MILQVDTDDLISQCYIRFEPIKDLKDLSNIFEFRILFSNMTNPKQLIDRYIINEKRRSFKSEDKAPRYCARFEILLPKEKIEKNKLVKIVSKFTKFVIQEEKGIKFISYIEEKKNISFLNIVFLDREYYEVTKVQRYISTMYRDKDTKRACKKDNSNAEVVCKKGNAKLDKSGKQIIETTYFKNTKTRKFIYSSGAFGKFICKFKRFWTQALNSLKAKVVKGKFIRRLNLIKAWNRFERRVILANNWMIQYIQNELNQLMQSTVRDVNWHDISNGASPNEIIIDHRKYELVNQLFSKYRKIFRDGIFTYCEVDFKIQKIQCNEAERNLELLKNIFEADKEVLLAKLG